MHLRGIDLQHDFMLRFPSKPNLGLQKEKCDFGNINLGAHLRQLIKNFPEKAVITFLSEATTLPEITKHNVLFLHHWFKPLASTILETRDLNTKLSS